jgi:hypothetical protein
MSSPQVDQTLEIRQSREAAELLRIGRQMGRRFTVLGSAPMPIQPVRVGEWLVSPAELDSTMLPPRAWDCLQAVSVNYAHPLRFVVVHEAPLGLPATTGEASLPVGHPGKSPKWIGLVKVLGWITAGLAAVTLIMAGLVMLAMVVTALAGVLMIPLALLIAASGLDPILVAVTEDGVWVELDRWES